MVFSEEDTLSCNSAKLQNLIKSILLINSNLMIVKG